MRSHTPTFGWRLLLHPSVIHAPAAVTLVRCSLACLAYASACSSRRATEQASQVSVALEGVTHRQLATQRASRSLAVRAFPPPHRVGRVVHCRARVLSRRPVASCTSGFGGVSGGQLERFSAQEGCHWAAHGRPAVQSGGRSEFAWIGGAGLGFVLPVATL